MESHKAYINNHRVSSSGFTLIEVLIVIALILIIVSSSLFFDVFAYRADAFHAERNNLVVALQTARANALNNVHQSKHGVAINPGGYQGYVIFEGQSYALSDPNTHTNIPALYPVALDPSSPTEIVFSQLSGDTTYDGAIILQDTVRTVAQEILINHEGKIGW